MIETLELEERRLMSEMLQNRQQVGVFLVSGKRLGSYVFAGLLHLQAFSELCHLSGRRHRGPCNSLIIKRNFILVWIFGNFLAANPHLKS